MRFDVAACVFEQFEKSTGTKFFPAGFKKRVEPESEFELCLRRKPLHQQLDSQRGQKDVDWKRTRYVSLDRLPIFQIMFATKSRTIVFPEPPAFISFIPGRTRFTQDSIFY